MPKEFAFTWLEALTRGPIFKQIEERAVLQGEQNEFLEAEETLERDLATANENWAATRHVVQTNIQLYVECEDQIKHYSNLCSSIPAASLLALACLSINRAKPSLFARRAAAASCSAL